MINEYSKIGVLKGIGEKTEQIFGKVGIATVGDLIRYYPHRYEVYEDPVPIGEVQEGHTVTVTGANLREGQCRRKPADADHHIVCERSDRYIESDLVSDAVSAQYTCERRCDHAAGQGGSGNGTDL